MATFSYPAFLDAYKTALENRAGLTGVTVSTVPLGTDTPRRAVVFHRVTQADTWHAMGHIVDETYTVSGQIYLEVPGAGDTAGKQARDEATAIMEEIRDELVDDPTVGGVVTHARVATVQYTPLVTDPPGRATQIEFDIEVKQFT